MLPYKNIISANLTNSACKIFIRWRKPIYAPIAPSKLFNVIKPCDQSTEEYYYLRKKYANYRSHMRSLQNYLSKNLENSWSNIHKVDKDLIDQHYKFIDESNLKFNEISAQFRRERESAEKVELEQRIKLELVEIEKQEKEQREKAIKLVLQKKKESVLFVTRESLDAAIDTALNQKSTFRFSIDAQGNRYEELADGSVKVVERKPTATVARQSLPSDGRLDRLDAIGVKRVRDIAVEIDAATRGDESK